MKWGEGMRLRNQIVKYYLTKWAYLDENLSFLSSVEMETIKVLYSALKELEPGERKVLADKYRVTHKPYKKDITLAEESGLSLDEYKSKRIVIEDKLQPILARKKEQYQAELEEAIRVEHTKKRRSRAHF